MSKYLIVSYKPSSSHARCHRGCCGYDEFESELRMNTVDSDAELQEVFYSTISSNLYLHEGEDGFDIYVFVDNKQVFSADYYGGFADDGFKNIEQAYTSAKDSAVKAKADAEEKVKAEEIEKKAKAEAEIQRQKEEKERSLLKELQEKYGK